MTDPSKLRDNISRIKRPSPLGSTIFVGLRLADPFLQYGLLARGLGAALIERLGGEAIVPGTPICDVLGLSPYRLVLLLMAVGSSVKQVFWLLAVSQEEMPPKNAALVAHFNTFLNTANSLVFCWALTSAAAGPAGEAQSFADEGFPSGPLVVGLGSYLLGIALETVSEVQRKRFKRDPNNAGKPYTGGLFSLARHINYGGYTLWRTGYALAAGGWVWASLVGGLFLYDFATRGVPVLDHYCQQKYGEVWTEYKAKVPYRFFPGIY